VYGLICRYELAYIESRAAGLARGQRVWQLAFGSGFKFNSCVLVANKRVQETHTAWKGFDSEVSLTGGFQHCAQFNAPFCACSACADMLGMLIVLVGCEATGCLAPPIF
jgi:hypothetical protein